MSCFNVAHMSNRNVYQLGQLLLRKTLSLSKTAYSHSDFFVIHNYTAFVVKIYLNYMHKFAILT